MFQSCCVALSGAAYLSIFFGGEDGSPAEGIDNCVLLAGYPGDEDVIGCKLLSYAYESRVFQVENFFLEDADQWLVVCDDLKEREASEVEVILLDSNHDRESFEFNSSISRLSDCQGLGAAGDENIFLRFRICLHEGKAEAV